MSSVRRAKGRLRELLVSGALASSQCSNALIVLVQPLIESGVLVWQRSGAGRRLVVQDSSILATFVSQKYPDAPAGSDLARVQGVAQYRDSKVLANDSPEILLLRFLSEHASADARGWTKQYGVCACDLRTAPALSGVCAVVENPALFFEVEKLGLGIDITLLARGRTSDRLVDWLACGHHNLERILHFPDYDPVGLSEYLRLSGKLGQSIRLYAPKDLEERFARFSNPGLLLPHKSSGLLASLRKATDADVKRVIGLLDRHNGGLEQEALLIPMACSGL